MSSANVIDPVKVGPSKGPSIDLVPANEVFEEAGVEGLGEKALTEETICL